VELVVVGCVVSVELVVVGCVVSVELVVVGCVVSVELVVVGWVVDVDVLVELPWVVVVTPGLVVVVCPGRVVVVTPGRVVVVVVVPGLGEFLCLGGRRVCGLEAEVIVVTPAIVVVGIVDTVVVLSPGGIVCPAAIGCPSVGWHSREENRLMSPSTLIAACNTYTRFPGPRVSRSINHAWSGLRPITVIASPSNTSPSWVPPGQAYTGELWMTLPGASYPFRPLNQEKPAIRRAPSSKAPSPMMRRPALSMSKRGRNRRSATCEPPDTFKRLAMSRASSSGASLLPFLGPEGS